MRINANGQSPDGKADVEIAQPDEFVIELALDEEWDTAVEELFAKPVSYDDSPIHAFGSGSSGGSGGSGGTRRRGMWLSFLTR